MELCPHLGGPQSDCMHIRYVTAVTLHCLLLRHARPTQPACCQAACGAHATPLYLPVRICPCSTHTCIGLMPSSTTVQRQSRRGPTPTPAHAHMPGMRPALLRCSICSSGMRRSRASLDHVLVRQKSSADGPNFTPRRTQVAFVSFFTYGIHIEGEVGHD